MFMGSLRSLSPFWIVPLLIAGAFLGGAARAFQVLVFAALVAALWSAGGRISGWLVPDCDRLSGAVATFTAAVAFATAVALVLGTCGGLRPRAFLLATAGLYLVACLAIRRRERPVPVAEPPAGRESRWEAVLMVAAALAVGIVGLVTLHGLRYAAPGFYGFDDVSYHLSAVAVWHRFGDLRMMKFAFGDPSTPFYPILSELWSWVLVAPFYDSDVAARWSQLPFAVFSAVAAAALARRLGLSTRSAALAAVLYLSIRYVLPELALTAGNDHTAGFFTLAALDGALATARRPGRKSAAYTGLATGLLAATKYLALFYAATLVLLLAAALLVRRRRGAPAERSLGQVLGLTGIALGVAILAGGYTYARNAWTTGNPFFPAPVHLLGHEVLPGWTSTGLPERLRQPEARIDVWNFLLHRPDLLGPLAAFTLLPAALLAPLAALLAPWGPRRRKAGEGPGGGERIGTALVLALPAVFFLEFLFFMHDHRDSRYFLAGIALAGVACAWLLEWAGPRVGAALRGLALLLVLHHLLRRFRPAIWQEALQVALLAGAAALAVHLWPRLRAWRARPASGRWAEAAGLAVLAVAAFPLSRVAADYQEGKLRGEPAASAVEERAGPGGVRIAYVGWNQPYLFFGSRFQNGVEVVPAAGDVAARFYDWGKTPEFPFDYSLPKRWLRSLDALGIEYVVVVRKGFADPERRWIEKRPWLFEKVFEDAVTEVWRIAR
jgi:dolichyl-phosphate-mannose-protein mannosyltransferase